MILVARRTRFASLLVLAAWGCRPGALPTWDPTEPAQPPAQAVSVSQAQAANPSPEGSDSTASTGSENAATPAPASPPANGAAPTSEVPAASPPPTATPPSLPKRLHPKEDAQCGKGPGLGQRVRPFRLTNLEGQSVTAATYAGRVVLLNFWGTWCKPCLEELPDFDRLYRHYRAHGLTLLAIATDDDPVPVREFVQDRRIAAKIALGGESYAGQYGSSIFPFSFVVDKKGVIIGSYQGFRPECMGRLEADVRKALANDG